MSHQFNKVLPVLKSMEKVIKDRIEKEKAKRKSFDESVNEVKIAKELIKIAKEFSADKKKKC